MRRWMGLVLSLLAMRATAGAYGVLPAGQTEPEFSRLGGDDGGLATVEFAAYLRADVSALLLYVDQVRTPGLLEVTLVPESVLPTPLKTGLAMVTGPGWVEFPLSGPAPSAIPHRLIVSTSGADLMLRHIQVRAFGLGPYDPEPLAWLARLPGDYQTMSTGVFRLAVGGDELADPTCGPVGAIQGSPYAFTRWVSLDAGSREQQSLAWVDDTGLPQGLWRLDWEAKGVVQWRTSTLDGGSFPVGPLGMVTHPPFVSELTPRNSVSAPFSLIASAGDGEWLLMSPGANLDVCHPAVRASFGGHRARALGEAAGADFAVTVRLREAAWLCPDADLDGAGGSGCQWMIPFGSPGWALDEDDCDDTDANIRPWAPEACDGIDSDCDGLADTADPSVDHSATEVCDGVDNDCDGLIDAADPALELPLCTNQVGLCGGARNLPSTCVSGAWQECTAASFGPLFGTSELTCDSQDFNCDGVISTRVACRRQLGICAGAFTSDCTRGVPSDCGSEAYGPLFELAESRCDGLDNDCNGLVDDIPIQACDRTLGVCAGTTTSAELCHESGLQACDGRHYGPLFELVERSCDGFDNDCDGLVDAADPDPAFGACELSLGVCAGARHLPMDCTGSGLMRCEPGRYGPAYEASELRCDGLDNDCDGNVDEGCVQAADAGTHLLIETSGCAGCTSVGSGALLLLLVLFARRRA